MKLHSGRGTWQTPTLMAISAVGVGTLLTVVLVPTASAADSKRAEARRLYDARCAVCHGASGGGDGPAAKSLHPAPRSFRERAFQRSVTDAQLAAVIVRGGAAVGKSPTMPAARELADKPVLPELVALLRSFGK